MYFFSKKLPICFFSNSKSSDSYTKFALIKSNRVSLKVSPGDKVFLSNYLTRLFKNFQFVFFQTPRAQTVLGNLHGNRIYHLDNRISHAF